MKTCTSRSLSCFCPHAVAVAACSSKTFLPLLIDGMLCLNPAHVQSAPKDMPPDFTVELVQPHTKTQ